MPQMLCTREYNREHAVEYARRWAYDRNPLFENYTGFGGDCTNFVSQCIFAGCCVMNFTETFGWYYLSPTERAPAWTGVQYLYNFLTTNAGEGPYAVEVGPEQIQIGDIIILGNREGVLYHSLIVTGFAPGAFLVAAHTNDAYNRRLDTYNYYSLKYLHIVGARVEVEGLDDCYLPLLEGRAIVTDRGEILLPQNGVPTPYTQPFAQPRGNGALERQRAGMGSQQLLFEEDERLRETEPDFTSEGMPLTNGTRNQAQNRQPSVGTRNGGAPQNGAAAPNGATQQPAQPRGINQVTPAPNVTEQPEPDMTSQPAPNQGVIEEETAPDMEGMPAPEPEFSEPFPMPDAEMAPDTTGEELPVPEPVPLPEEDTDIEMGPPGDMPPQGVPMPPVTTQPPAPGVPRTQTQGAAPLSSLNMPGAPSLAAQMASADVDGLGCYPPDLDMGSPRPSRQRSGVYLRELTAGTREGVKIESQKDTRGGAGTSQGNAAPDAQRDKGRASTDGINNSTQPESSGGADKNRTNKPNAPTAGSKADANAVSAMSGSAPAQDTAKKPEPAPSQRSAANANTPAQADSAAAKHTSQPNVSASKTTGYRDLEKVKPRVWTNRATKNR